MKQNNLLVLAGLLLIGFFTFYYAFQSNVGNIASFWDRVATVSNIDSSQVALPLISTNDNTPRIAYWWGKVNQHVDSQGFWRSDPDGTSGANLDKFAYCKKWYPNTLGLRDYKVETITAWKRAAEYEQSDYIRVVTSIECVQDSVVVPPPVVQNPPAIYINASPNPSPYGGVVVLNWNVSNATACLASNGWTGNKNINGGSQSIANMNAATTFVLSCTGPGGSSSSSVYVPVNQPVVEKIKPAITLTAFPNPAPHGGITNLSWDVSDADSCTASNGWTGNKNANGGFQVIGNIKTNTTFVMTCTGPGGSSTASVPVVVNAPVVQQSQPTVSIIASPNPAQYGGIVDLNWNVTNATSCTASNGWTGGKNPNGGSQSIGNMTAATTFILTCTGPGGTSSSSVYVPVNQPVVQNPPVVNNNPNIVISPVTNTQATCPVFTKYLKKGSPSNDRNEVLLWQAFLNKYEGFNLALDGSYGGKTEIAIRAFQTKYREYILIPWGISEATGYTYKTTRAYANFLLGCPEGGFFLDNGTYVNFK